jgi:hypothetical protein
VLVSFHVVKFSLFDSFWLCPVGSHSFIGSHDFLDGFGWAFTVFFT